MSNPSDKNPVLSNTFLRHVAPARAWVIETIQRMACRNNIRGLARLAWLGRRLVMGTGIRIVEYRGRFRFFCACDSWYGVMTALGFLHREMDRLLHLLRRERTSACTYIDVGANAGFVSLLMASSAGKDSDHAHVHCFEPNPNAFQMLSTNVALNDFDITVNNAALGAKAARAILTIGTDSTGSSLVPGGLSYVSNAGEREVELITLDDYCRGLQVRPDVVKVDVEGYEPFVLQGGRKTLSTACPYLIVEINSKALREGGSSANSLLALLADLDYRVFHIDAVGAGVSAGEAKTRERWHGYPEVRLEDLAGECLFDVVGVPISKR